MLEISHHWGGSGRHTARRVSIFTDSGLHHRSDRKLSWPRAGTHADRILKAAKGQRLHMWPSDSAYTRLSATSTPWSQPIFHLKRFKHSHEQVLLQNFWCLLWPYVLALSAMRGVRFYSAATEISRGRSLICLWNAADRKARTEAKKTEAFTQGVGLKGREISFKWWATERHH